VKICALVQKLKKKENQNSFHFKEGECVSMTYELQFFYWNSRIVQKVGSVKLLTCIH